jgi:hypothetical protein
LKKEWDQANRRQKLGLVWRNRKKISLPLLTDLPPNYFLVPAHCRLEGPLRNCWGAIEGCRLFPKCGGPTVAASELYSCAIGRRHCSGGTAAPLLVPRSLYSSQNISFTDFYFCKNKSTKNCENSTFEMSASIYILSLFNGKNFSFETFSQNI